MTTYEKLNQLLRWGQLDEMMAFVSAKNIDLSDHVLWADENTKGSRTTPILLAIENGNLEITRYLLMHYPKTVSIDHHFNGIQCHYIPGTLLHVALSNNKSREVDLVKCILEAGVSPRVRNAMGRTPLHLLLYSCYHSDYRVKAVLHCLVEYGADVNAVDATGNSPLHTLVHFNRDRITGPIRFLIEHGADVNARNELGVTPLMIAARFKNIVLPTIRCLLKNGADPDVLDGRGFSVLHHVVFHTSSVRPTDRDSSSLLELLSKGANPLFQSAPCSNEERQQYVPCPLYISASRGVEDEVDEFLEHPQCPLVCKAEAYLLLASTEIDENGLSLRSQELWSEALSIYEENDIHPAYLPPIEAYGNRVEIQSVKELQELVSPSPSVHEAHYQSLIIRERCIGMGYGCRSLIEALTARARTLHEEGKHSEGEWLFLRLIDVIIHVLDHVKVYDHSDHWLGIDYTRQYYVRIFYSFMCDWLKKLSSIFVPNFERIVKHCNGLYSTLSRHYKSEHHHPIFLALFLLSLACEVTLNSGPSRLHCSLEEFGRHLVLNVLQEPDTLKLLHVSLFIVLQMEFKCLSPSFSILNREHSSRSSNIVSTMSSALLRWGAYKFLDQPNSEGQRFLHLAVQSKYAAEVVPILLEYSPHLDAVDADGKTVFDLCTSDELRSLFPSTPHPLSCQAAKVVVSENIPYQELDLPAHIKSLISLHDCHHLRRQY